MTYESGKWRSIGGLFETGISDTATMLRHEAAPLLLKAHCRCDLYMCSFFDVALDGINQ